MTELKEFNVTFRGDEANQLFFEPVFRGNGIFSGSYRFLTDVRTKRKLTFVGEMERIVRKYAGCGFNPVGSLEVYDRWIEVNKMKADVSQCWDEFKDTVFEELMNRGVRFPDLTDTLMGEILMTQTQSAISKDVERLAYFGDESSLNPDTDPINGFWSVLYPEMVADGLIPRANIASGSAIPAGDGLAAIKAVYEQADLRLRALPNNLKAIYVTGSVYEAYESDLISLGAGTPYLIDTTQNGTAGLSYKGIRVIPMWFWDLNLAANQHRIEYRANGNNVIATDSTNPESQIAMWYEMKDETLNIKSRFTLGAQIIHPSLVSLGY